MKRLFFALTVVSLLISCLMETEISGMPKIENSRILGYDQLSDKFIEKHIFYISGGDWPYLEFTAHDNELDINEITITLYNDASPDGKMNFVYALYQSTNPQTWIYPIQGWVTEQNNLWYARFFVTDKNGKRSKIHESDRYMVLP